ncbi:hypothetical protein GQX73_g5778 [Xylaria multiplex]|uniref:Uncharacterized protein n=1 Tax=Xylaria multiplex TaxID=323545 RepID=A0A7C8J064_9PEZI|nr:hypothetical protein GQX73_g5778 [Xylaria multiplex]
MTAAISAAARFASIEELLLILAEYIHDGATLWALCLSNWRFNCVFTPKLSERVVVRVKERDDEATVQRIVDSLLAGPYLHDLRHLKLIINNGPVFPEKTLEMVRTLLSATTYLKVFTWDSADGDIPVSILVHLSEHCRHVEELHLLSGPELNNYSAGFRDVMDRPTFESCPNVEKVEMTHMGYMLALGWVHSGYHAHLRALIAREEASRSRSGRPLKMDMCYSRSAKAAYDCEVCDSPDMRSYKPGDSCYSEVWPWASGRARQYLHEGHVRHITYEYPHPEPSESTAPSGASWHD